MKKRVQVFLLIVIVILMVIYCSFNLFYHYWGPQINDNFASEQMRSLLSTPMPDTIEMRDHSVFIGKLEEDEPFAVWVSNPPTPFDKRN